MNNVRKEVIGNCTLYHGDCLEMLPTLGKMDAVITDPPYLAMGKGISANFTSGVGKRINEKKTVSDPWGATLEWVKPAYEIADKAFFSFCSYHFLSDLCQEVGVKPSAIITWYQRNAMPPIANAPHFQTEFCCAFRKAKGVTWRGLKTMINIPRLQSGCMASERIVNGNGQAVHPSQKPVELISRLILPGIESIMDNFMGTGTTGVAAVNAGIKFTGIERDLSYFDIACRRIEEAVKKEASRLPGFAVKAKPQQVGLF